MDSFMKRIEENRKAHARWIAWAVCLSILVSFGVFTGFHQRALTKSYTRQVLDCPYAAEGIDTVAHTHGSECYDNGVLVCLLQERDAHVHGEDCYEEQTTLICGMEENTGHQHNDTCYREERIQVCELDENPGHQHSEECCDEEGNFRCGLEAEEGHTHSENCFVTEMVLTCGFSEGEGAHFHTEDCQITERVLTCTEPELTMHVHDENCIESVIVDEKDKEKKADEKKDDDQPEGKRPPEKPVSDLNADLETAEIWEKAFKDLKLTGNWAKDLIIVAGTQIGYRESSRNFDAILDEDKDDYILKGWTRYGSWYGIPYGDWCAMFVSFCLNYAKIPRTIFPYDCGTTTWIRSLEELDYYADASDYTPKPGDLIFFDWERDGLTDHVGLVCEVNEEDARLSTIEGNHTMTVEFFEYDLHDGHIMGYGILPEKPDDYNPEEQATENQPAEGPADTTESKNKEEKKDKEEEDTDADEEPGTADGMPMQSFFMSAGGIDVSAEATAGAFPEGTEMCVTPVNGNNLIHVISGAVNGEILEVQAVDIQFISAEGKSIGAASPIRVTITLAQTLYSEERTSVVYIDKEGSVTIVEQVEDDRDGGSEAVFEADSFAIYAIVYLTRFEYEVDGQTYLSKIPGAKDILLSDLLSELNLVGGAELDEFMQKITEVAVSDPEALQQTETEKDWVIRPLKDSSEQNTITITLQDGAVFKVGVEAYGKTEIGAEDDPIVISTVNNLFLPEDAAVSGEVLTEEQSESAITMVQVETAEAAEENPDAVAESFDMKTAYQVFDISLENVKPEEYERGFQVCLNFPESILGRDFRLYHIHDNQVDELELRERKSHKLSNGTELVSSVSFITPSFNDFVLSYTVDFHCALNAKIYDFTIPNGGFVSFEKMAEMLGLACDTETVDDKSTEIAGVSYTNQATTDPISLSETAISDEARKFIADVRSVHFSNPELVWVGKTMSETSVGVLKEAFHLDIEYSKDLTEEQIAEINAQTVEAGDWALISLTPFDTEELLTVTMNSGEIITVLVNDGQIKKNDIVSSGETYEITVIYDKDAQIPDGAELKVREILEGTEEYDKYMLDSCSELGLENGELSFCRFFDIEIVGPEGEKIEPKVPVQVNIEYKDAVELGKDETLNVIHFAETDNSAQSKPEVISDININNDATVISYEQASFSVTGIVVRTLQNVKPDTNDSNLDEIRVEKEWLTNTGNAFVPDNPESVQINLWRSMYSTIEKKVNVKIDGRTQTYTRFVKTEPLVIKIKYKYEIPDENSISVECAGEPIPFEIASDSDDKWIIITIANTQLYDNMTVTVHQPKAATLKETNVEPENMTRDAKKVDIVSLSEENEWSHLWIVQGQSNDYRNVDGSIPEKNSSGETYYYYITEEAVEGFVTRYSFTEAVNSGAVLKVTNQSAEPAQTGAELKIYKTDSTSGNQIGGAIFQILKMDQSGQYSAITKNELPCLEEENRFTVSDTGFNMAGLSDGTYRIEEVRPPKGYILTGNNGIDFTVNDGTVTCETDSLTEGTSYQAAEGLSPASFTIPNTSGAELPQTGGAGTTFSTIFGMFMATVPGALIIRNRRKENV